MDGDKIVEDLLVFKVSLQVQRFKTCFKICDTFICENNLDWTKCIGVHADSGHSTSSWYGGLHALIQGKAPDALWNPCIIHREALV